MVFSTEEQKQGLISSLQNFNGATGKQLAEIYQNIPVAQYTAPAQFLTTIVPTIAQTPLYAYVYPSLIGVTNLQIVGERQLPVDAKAGISQVLGPQFGTYDITFTKNGVSMKGVVFAWTTNVGYGSPFWWGNIWLIAAPADQFDRMEPTLMEIFNSLEVSPQWMQSCSEVSAYMGKVGDEVYTNKQETQNREQFEMQNLEELAPGDWNTIPLDGSLHIR